MQPSDPHFARQKLILKVHPEIVDLYGTDLSTAVYSFAVVGVHLLTAYASSGSIYIAVLGALAIGAFCDLGIMVAIHELSHHLVFKTPLLNNMLSLFVNIPLLFPISAIFNQHHRKHHQYLGDAKSDVDVPSNYEVKLVGNSAFRKFVWLAFSGFILAYRSMQKLGSKVTSLLCLNWVTSLGFAFFLLYFFPVVFTYFFVSTLCSMGFHPSNTRIVQRHIHPDQNVQGSEKERKEKENYVNTFSYYGYWNPFTLNVGYHVEHHDFPRIPWRNLPLVTKIAPEFYETHPAHETRGWVSLVRFVFDDRVNLAQYF